MRVPFFRSPWQAPPQAERLTQALRQVLLGGHYILGPALQQLESSLGTRLAGRGVLGLNSGTDALVMALRCLDLSPGDEVVLPSYTFFACFEAVLRVGARPVLCDSRRADFLAGAEQVQAVLGERTRAVLAVPLFGDASAMPGLAHLCRARGLPLIEDAAQALGAWTPQEDGQRVAAGCFGDLSTLSFYPTKTLGAVGDAGALSSRDAALLARARALRNHGLASGGHTEPGYNSRLDELQAVVLQQGLGQLDEWLTQRQAVAERYRQGLAGIAGLVLPEPVPGHAWNYFVLRHRQRDRLHEHLHRVGIDVRIYYERPIHLQAAYQARFPAIDLPHASFHAAQALALPMFPGLRVSEVDAVIEAIHGAIALLG